MKITDIRIYPNDKGGNLKASVSVTFDDVFAVKDIKIVQGQNGLFVSMPSRKTANGEYSDICFPVKKEFREELSTAILTKYDSQNSFGG